MTTTIKSVCLKCGTIAKSGKNSCCGRGGSWFRNCGSAGNVKLRHTWHEGIQACKIRSQFKVAMGRQSNAARQTNSSDDIVNPKTVMANAKVSIFTSDNASTPMSTITPIITSVTNTSTEQQIVTDWLSEGV